MATQGVFVLVASLALHNAASFRTLTPSAPSDDTFDEDLSSLLQTKLGPAIEVSQHSSNNLNEEKKEDALKQTVISNAELSSKPAANSTLNSSGLQEERVDNAPKEMVQGDAGLSDEPAASSNSSRNEIALVHVPYNFGNTVEKVAFFPKNSSAVDYVVYIGSQGTGSFAIPDHPATWESVEQKMKPGGKAFGHLNPDLQVPSNVTKCPLYLTPPKYWPEDVAKKYFGKAQRFGIIRDPFEKLVAQVRGAMADYGGVAKKDVEECAINRAVKKRMKEIIASGDFFSGGCANVPQHEYFEGDYGIQIAVDNWRFPDSMNEVFSANGYDDWLIEEKDILHVAECQEHWSKEFDQETRDLVKKVYAKDFDLICEKFGHCNFDEDTCLQGVPTMCPPNLFAWNESRQIACPKPGVNLTGVRTREKCQVEQSGAREIGLQMVLISVLSMFVLREQ